MIKMSFWLFKLIKMIYINILKRAFFVSVYLKICILQSNMRITCCHLLRRGVLLDYWFYILFCSEQTDQNLHSFLFFSSLPQFKGPICLRCRHSSVDCADQPNYDSLRTAGITTAVITTPPTASVSSCIGKPLQLAWSPNAPFLLMMASSGATSRPFTLVLILT